MIKFNQSKIYKMEIPIGIILIILMLTLHFYFVLDYDRGQYFHTSSLLISFQNALWASMGVLPVTVTSFFVIRKFCVKPFQVIIFSAIASACTLIAIVFIGTLIDTYDRWEFIQFQLSIASIVSINILLNALLTASIYYLGRMAIFYYMAYFSKTAAKKPSVW